MLDLDDFKGLNDTLGCQIGDLLLVAAARRLEEVTRSSDTLCRLRGDEFLYLAEGLEFPAQAEKVAARLLGAVAEPFSLAGTRLEQRASIGIVAWEGKSKDFTELLQDADVALCDAKRQGEG
jgi:diguanylate cyclase (GGDEF)-like protein